jgi:uncharacterized lipoprotein
MRKASMIRIGAGLLALLALGGCKLFKGASCHEPQAYETARSVPPLQVPAGLESPATKSALKIPDLKTPERKRGATEPCLDEPPSYYPGKPRPGASPVPPPPEPPAPSN